jgi:hypothetical protein
MVNEIAVQEDFLHAGAEAVLQIYEMMSALHINPPSLSSIHGQYCSTVDTRIIGLQASLYPDDFYDGNPDRKAKRHLPDMISSDITRHIGMPENILVSEIEEILCAFNMTYEDRVVFNSPIKEVW